MEILTQSRLRSLRFCPRHHELAYEQGIRTALPGKAFRIGTAVHDGIWLSEQGHPNPIGEAVLRCYGTGYPEWVTDQMEYDLEVETVSRMLAGYFWRWEQEPNHAFNTIAAELTLELPLVNPGTGRRSSKFGIAIKVDGIIDMGDHLAIRETKTAGESIGAGQDYWRRLRIDPQISLAILAARENGYNVSSSVYDVIRKPTISPKLISAADRKKIELTGLWFEERAEPVERETPFMWGARLRADMGERPEYYFARMEIARTDDEIREFRRDLWDSMQALRGYRKRGHWPRNADACLARGKCPYFDSICSMGRHLRNGDELPSGFIKLVDVHPELGISRGDEP